MAVILLSSKSFTFQYLLKYTTCLNTCVLYEKIRLIPFAIILQKREFLYNRVIGIKKNILGDLNSPQSKISVVEMIFSCC